MKTKQLFISLILGLGLTLALLWLLGGSPPMARAQGPDRYDTYYVAPGEDCGSVTPCYISVQAAVKEASDGDIIKVAAGVYTGVQTRAAPPGYPEYDGPTVITQVVYINKTITICGGYTTTNWTTPHPITQPTKLDAHEQGRVVFITGDINPTIEGLHITGGNAAGLGGHTTPAGDTRGAGGGVYVFNATATISNNQVFNNAADFGGGLYLKNSVATLSGNIIRDNSAKSNGGGLFVYVGAPTLSGNTITDNKAENGGGGLFVRQSDPTLSGNTISDNTADVGGGLRLAEQTSATLSYNTIAFNTAERSGGGLSLANYCTVTLSHNDIIANIAGWDGGGLRLTEYSSATLSDNTIKANTANFGGGLFLALTSTATISDNTFICNSARGAGGGLRLTQNGSARLISNTITANTAYNGGGMHLNNSIAELSDNIFAANEALHNGGGLMLAFTSTATLSGNTFATNEAKHGGGGLYVCQHSSATLSGDTVISNTIDAADYGGGGGLALTTTSTLTCTNAIIADNRLNGPPGIGTGLVIGDSSARLLHTTIARNSGGDDSGIHVTERHGTYSTVALTNTILVGHKVGITVTAGNTATLEATLWGTATWANRTADWGGAGSITTGTVNVWGDPAFVDPDAGDYHIGPSSAALDRGVHTGVTVDFDGDQRPVGTRPDLGADEFPAVADLAITKTDLLDPVVAGYNLDYELQVTNNGPLDATDVTLIDVLPTGVRFVGFLPGTLPCTEEGGTVTCDLGTLTSGASETVWLVVHVYSSTVGTITNTASVTATEPDPDPSNNTATEDTTVTSEADLAITKTDWPDPVVAGENLTYTLLVTNTGNVDLHATVTDILPDHVAPTGTRTWTPVITAPGGVWTRTVVVTVEMGYAGTLTNVVKVTTDEGATGIYTETSTSLTPAINVIKKASVDTAHVGETITYTYTVTNTGDVTLTDVKANDNRRGAIGLGTTALAPGEITTGTATHTVIVGDLLRGPLVNTVTVTGTSLVGNVVTDTDDTSVDLERFPICVPTPVVVFLVLLSVAVLLVLLSVVLRRKT
jgi:uncharacterized repeat protein (TIGR01451 family)